MGYKIERGIGGAYEKETYILIKRDCRMCKCSGCAVLAVGFVAGRRAGIQEVKPGKKFWGKDYVETADFKEQASSSE